MIRSTLRFGWDLLAAPSKALRRFNDPDAALGESIAIYVVYILVSIAFYTWKPESFPPPSPDTAMPALGGGPHGLLFWTQVQLWEPVLSALWVVCLAAFSGLFQSQFAPLPIQIMLAGIAGVIPLAPLVLYRKSMIHEWAFLLSWIALLALFIPFFRRRTKSNWKRLVSMSLALNVIGLVLTLPVCIAVVAQADTAYNALHYAMLFWTLGLGAYLLGRLDEISTPRAFTALVLSLVWQILMVFSLHLMDLVSKDILKAMMSI